MQGFPELKSDGSKYQTDDYLQVSKEVWWYATKIADDKNLHSLEPVYDECNKRRPLPGPKAVSLKVISKKPNPDPLSQPLRMVSSSNMSDNGTQKAVSSSRDVSQA